MEADRSLNVLCEGNTLKPPFYLIHAADGHVASYFRLLLRLDNSRPIKGVESILLRPGFPLVRSSALVAHYGQLIGNDCGGKSAILGGWSYGGLLAYRIVLLLEKMGIDVRGLVLLDTAPHLNQETRIRLRYLGLLEYYAIDNPNAPIDTLPLWFQRLLSEFKSSSVVDRFIMGSRSNPTVDQLRHFASFVLRSEPERLAGVLGEPEDDLLGRLISATAASDPTFTQTFSQRQGPAAIYKCALVYKTNMIDGARIAVSKKVGCPIASFGARDTRHISEKWSAYTSRDFELYSYDIAGVCGKTSHGSMMDDINISLYANDLASYLDRCDKRN